MVVVPFPFADRAATRRRPALVVSRADPLGNVVGHWVLAMITSAAHRRWPLDVPVGDLAAAGLPAPSVVRLKLFTLDGRLIERRAGALGADDAGHVRAALARMLGFKMAHADYLTAFAGAGDAQAQALTDLLTLSPASTARRGSATWTRDELHERDIADDAASS